MEGKLSKEEYTTFIESMLKKLKEAAVDEKTGLVDRSTWRVLEELHPDFLHYQPESPPPHLQGLSRLRPDSTHEEETAGGLNPVWKERYIKLIFLLGRVGGYFYGREHPTFPLKYTLGEESDRVIWQNADLLFVEKGVLHVIDFKLGGAHRTLQILLQEEVKCESYFTPLG